MVTGGVWGNMDIYVCGDSLELTVVFKCSMVTGGVWGSVEVYFLGLLGVDVVFKCLEV
jgi:hypothetical protein